VFEVSWNPGYDSTVLVPFWELYALTHTIQRTDAHRGEDKPGAIASEWRELAQSVERLDYPDIEADNEVISSVDAQGFKGA
jgi:hypothetical protein